MSALRFCSIGVDSLLIVLPVWGSVFVSCFVVNCVVSFLVL